MSSSDRPDPQLELVYAWEDSWWGWNKSLISFDESQRWIKLACRAFEVHAPSVTRHYTRALSWSIPQYNIISMQNDGGLNIPISLHEASHHIVWHRYGDKAHDHGPTFVGVYLRLLEKAKVASPEALRSSLKKFNVRWRQI